MKLEVKLTQHTPIIHFQWDQDGATLRASELKPKLDKYLKEKNIPELKELFGAKGNLPYKLIISPIEEKNNISEIEETRKDIHGDTITDYRGRPKKYSFPTYFGNIGDAKEKRFVFYNHIKLKFISFNLQVIEVIKRYLPEFLFVTNFGTRQSKGFGSFFIDSTDSLYKKPESIMKDQKKFAVYYFTISALGSDLREKYKNLFYSIDLFYRTLRSGINIKDRNDNTIFYFKSLIFLYAKEKNWTWDKKAIKEKFVSKELGDQLKQYPGSDILKNYEQQYLVRDLLGLAPLQNYMSYKLEEYNNKSFSIQYDENNEIQRFMSPILFKPLIDGEDKFTVYIILKTLDDGIFNKPFDINKVIKINKNEIKKLDSINLVTPPCKNFDLFEFFNFALSKISEIGIDNYVEKSFQNTNEYKIIKDIYNQLTVQKGMR